MFTYFHFMKHCFDFKGKASRTELFFSVLSYAFVGGFLRICEALIWNVVFDMSPELASKLSITGLFGTIALYALCVRRLRDAGYKEKTLKWIAFSFGPHIAFFISMIPNEISVK